MRKNVVVFVYGDIGRSPRMQNHAYELSKYYNVSFMGFVETAPRNEILHNEHINLINLKIPYLQPLKSFSFYLYALVLIILQICQIMYMFVIRVRRIEFVLVQVIRYHMKNPPCIPNLFAIWLASLVCRFKIVVDFHNYGYTILALNVRNKFILKFAKLYEHIFVKKASIVFCVSQSMKLDLKQNWGITATTLYDRPRPHTNSNFNPDNFLAKYSQSPLKNNQLLLVSSTSWTKDQDFSLLLDALQEYDRSPNQISIRTFITGKGPEKEYYLGEIDKRKGQWSKISIETLWLEPEDYPRLLSLCQLGVSLHYSSSGLDLPMKVVDMFAAGLPVLAVNYPALSELVKDGVTGFVFSDRKKLFQQLSTLTNQPQLLQKLTKAVQQQRAWTWQKQWQDKCKPLLVY